MQQKSVAASRTQAIPESSSAPGVVQKLKSERVQLQLQVPAKEQRRVQATSGGRYAVGRDVILSFELITQEAVAPPGIVEAGPASGTPGQNLQPSTERKEVDHG